MSTDSKEMQSPFHAGEKTVQARMGVTDIEEWARKVVLPFMPEQHRVFHTSLPFIVAAARDGEGRPWATLLTGPDGFIASPDPRSLIIESVPVAGDALESALLSKTHLGLLGIELATRRRNRINGRVRSSGAGHLIFSVDQAFGNCPQYIRERAWRRVENNRPGRPMRRRRLSRSQQAWIAAADTFFIASGHQGEQSDPTSGMDASHRGGEPGFVRVVNDTRLRFPDYAGNNHFNTIGNFLLDPKAGFLFVDFVSGGLLQLTGKTTIDWESDAVAEIPGARRLITFDIDEIIELPSAVPLRWNATADSVRSLRLIEKTPESNGVTSFVFEARDGGKLPSFEAGQYLPLELDIPGATGSVSRLYSLSSPPSTSRYRITVRRDPKGLVSRFLHDQVEVGAFVNTRKPTGDLILSCDECPVVLISAGVGITPMASILHALVTEKSERPIKFLHGARNGEDAALVRELRSTAKDRPNVEFHIAYSRPLPHDRLGTDYHSKGRLSEDLIRNQVKCPDAQYLICGPASFLVNIQNMLENAGVPTANIHIESFGPKG